MPLSTDQYNVRRVYRNGKLTIYESKAQRDPNTGASIGQALTQLDEPLNYNSMSITDQDIQQYGEIIQRVKKKVQITYIKKYQDLNWSKVVVKIDGIKYNVVQKDVRFERDMYLYLSTVSEGRSSNHA